MNHLIIGIRNEGVDNIHQLPPQLTVAGTDVTIHCDPTVRVVNHRFVTNCHIGLDLTIPGDDRDGLLALALGGQYHHIPRLGKTSQYAHLLAAQCQDPEGPLGRLRLPEHMVASVTRTSGRRNMKSIDKMGSSFGHRAGEKFRRVVVKPDNGARGLGQALINIDDLRAFMSDLDMSYKALKNKYPNALFSNPDSNHQNQKEEEMKLADLGHWAICEYIENIASEYRVIVSGDRFYIAERQISEGDYPQANLDLHKANGKRDFTEVPASHSLYPIIEAIVEVFNLRIGSIDLFQTQDGQYGFFESCPQFGMNTLPHDFASDIHYGYIKWLVENYRSVVFSQGGNKG